MDLTSFDDDKTFTPHKTDRPRPEETHGSSKQWGSPPAKKACIEGSRSHKMSKSKSHKTSGASQDEWEEDETSTKEPEYKKMHYLTFALVTHLEQEIFDKCSFDQPPMSPVSSLGFRQAFPRLQKHL